MAFIYTHSSWALTATTQHYPAILESCYWPSWVILSGLGVSPSRAYRSTTKLRYQKYPCPTRSFVSISSAIWQIYSSFSEHYLSARYITLNSRSYCTIGSSCAGSWTSFPPVYQPSPTCFGCHARGPCACWLWRTDRSNRACRPYGLDPANFAYCLRRPAASRSRYFPRQNGLVSYCSMRRFHSSHVLAFSAW